METWQYSVFAVMGVLCGLLGPVYVNFRLQMLKVKAILDPGGALVQAASSCGV